jgi:hypothetical protein
MPSSCSGTTRQYIYSPKKIPKKFKKFLVKFFFREIGNMSSIGGLVRIFKTARTACFLGFFVL